MRLDAYQERAHHTAVYPPGIAIEYLTLGLVGEAGEIANKVKKLLRGDPDPRMIEAAIKDELGDVLWYLAELANELCVSLEVVALRNLEKLDRRRVQGQLKGSGDLR